MDKRETRLERAPRVAHVPGTAACFRLFVDGHPGEVTVRDTPTVRGIPRFSYAESDSFWTAMGHSFIIVFNVKMDAYGKRWGFFVKISESGLETVPRRDGDSWGILDYVARNRAEIYRELSEAFGTVKLLGMGNAK